MTECYIQVEDDSAAVRCDNCGWKGLAGALQMVTDIQERIDPGFEVPAGECPECGALAYLVEKPAHSPFKAEPVPGAPSGTDAGAPPPLHVSAMVGSLTPDQNFDRHGTPRSAPAAQWPCKRLTSYSRMQQGLALSLVPYASDDDANLSRENFLRLVASRIADDLQHGTASTNAQAPAPLGPSVPAAAFEAAARARGWRHGGDNGGIIYNERNYESWKAAVSWSPQHGPVYDSWQECCEAEDIEPGYPYAVNINYQTATSGNTYACTVTALDDDSAVDKATAMLKADRRRKVMKIDGGDVERIPAAG